ncbi:MAG: terminase [Chloroflexi bacterium]|nr:MAG: terminase [Chloroflexota bacterium]
MLATMFENPKADMLYLAPTYPLIRDIWYPKIESFLDDLGHGYFINRGENTIKVQGAGKIFCRTMEHPGRIIGFEVLDAFLDELDVLTEDKAVEVWRKTKARCRQKIDGKPNQMYVTTTPEGFKATYKLFKKDPLPGSHLIQLSTYSNAHNLPDDYIDELKDNYPANLIEAYINGVFINLKNMPVWATYDENSNNSRERVKKADTLLVGMDFNVGRGCAVIYVKRGWSVHAVDEIYNSYDTPDTIRVLNERYPEHDITVYPDASGGSRKSVNATTSDLAILREAGYKVKTLKKNPNIKDRVMATNRMFCNGHMERNLFVNKDTCPRLSAALVEQIYDDNGLPEKGIGKYDDMTDAGSYPIAYLYPIKKSNTKRMEL